MQANWVDFRAIKQAVTIEQVLARYGVKLKRSGKELRGKCPIHQGEGTGTFHASTEKNAFQCFSCGAKGNVLDFVAAMEHCSVREAAVKLRDWFSVGGILAAAAAREQPGNQLAPEEEAGERSEANTPLGFTLKGIDYSHQYLSGRGIDRQTAEYFGVGFFPGKGSMAGRVVIPIENEQGELVAYAGRSIDGSEPKYKLPAGFKKRQVLYNLKRAAEETEGLVVLVEGFFDCIRVSQAEYPAVALMGCAISEQQEQQLIANFRQVVIMLDGDEAGRKATAEIASRLVRYLWVRVVEVTEGRQPDELPLAELRLLLGSVFG
ncbi:MAG: hypothetical protein C5B51_01680 [Terriglobia bacterium]|nr:MAG: hypothetical protein C5B51_01680 [Terriglobia bacterium]